VRRGARPQRPLELDVGGEGRLACGGGALAARLSPRHDRGRRRGAGLIARGRGQVDRGGRSRSLGGDVDDRRGQARHQGRQLAGADHRVGLGLVALQRRRQLAGVGPAIGRLAGQGPHDDRVEPGRHLGAHRDRRWHGGGGHRGDRLVGRRPREQPPTGHHLPGQDPEREQIALRGQRLAAGLLRRHVRQ
jgi:hypothetical protein